MELLGAVAIVCLTVLAATKLWIDHRERSHKRALEHRPLHELEQRMAALEGRLNGLKVAPLLGRKFG